MLNDLDFLIFSSEKTANCTIMSTLNHHGYNSLFCHGVFNFRFWNIDITNDNFLNVLENYKNTVGKKLKVITVLRNPLDRFVSAFFQMHYDNQIELNNILPENTIIIQNTVESLYDIILESLEYVPIYESIWELSDLFGEDILEKMVKKPNHYYYENDYITMVVLRFDMVNNPSYLSSCLDIQIPNIVSSNLTINKVYSDKFKEVKQKLLQNDVYISKIYSLYKYDIGKNAVFFNFD